MTHSPSPVLAERHGGVGLLTLNRPRALHALDLDSVRALHAALRAWADDAQVFGVLLRSTPSQPPALCAGGDLKFFHRAARAGDKGVDAFLSEEYALDHAIHRYPKPVLACMDGIVMGGGMGISQGAWLRVLTERSRLSMPEVRIGLFPDVGGSWFLGRCPGRVGEYLALTGDALGAADALACGLGDRMVDSAALDALSAQLLQARSAESWSALVDAAARDPGEPQLLRHREAIDRHFCLPDLPAVLDSLRSDPGDFARSALQMIAQGAPQMLALSLQLVRRGRGMQLADVLRMERVAMHHCFHPPGGGGDALEGIRALVIDKDRNPHWRPARVEDVDAAAVEAFLLSPWAPAQHPLAGLVDA